MASGCFSISFLRSASVRAFHQTDTSVADQPACGRSGRPWESLAAVSAHTYVPFARAFSLLR